MTLHISDGLTDAEICEAAVLVIRGTELEPEEVQRFMLGLAHRLDDVKKLPVCMLLDEDQALHTAITTRDQAVDLIAYLKGRFRIDDDN
jgi:hypothetical protein